MDSIESLKEQGYSAETARGGSKHYEQRQEKYDESFIGKKNNMLTVIGLTHGENGKKRFICECDCGNTKLIVPTHWATGKIKSCGCYAESLKNPSPDVVRLKGIFRGMMQRCYNPNHESYKNYGGRGIRICDEWLNDRNAFIEWALTHGHRNDLSIDRINNDGNYEPDNCRWADAVTQASNQRPKQGRYYYDGGMHTKKEIAEMTGTSLYKLNRYVYGILPKGCKPNERDVARIFGDSFRESLSQMV